MLSGHGDIRRPQDHGELKGSDKEKKCCVFGRVGSEDAQIETKSSGIVLEERT